jgi:PEGA domain-containing protein
LKLTVVAVVVLAALVIGAIVWVFVVGEAPAPPRPKPVRETSEASPESAAGATRGSHSTTLPEPASGGWIGGLVVDARGKPVEGAQVWLARADEADVPAESAATTGRDGRWRLPVRDGGLRDLGASKPGWMPVLERDVRIDASARRDDLRLELSAGASITGHVRHPNGRALAGVRLACVADAAPVASWREDSGRLPGRASLGAITLVAKTGADGAYAFQGLEPRAAFRVSPIADKFFTTKATGDEVMKRVAAPAANVDFTMQASCVVVVRVVDGATSEPVGGCSLELTGPTVLVKRVPDSWTEPIRLDRSLKPGSYRLVVQARCFELADRQFDLAEGAAPLELTVRLARTDGVVPGTLLVTARDDLGAPVPDLSVTATGPGDLVESVAGDEESETVRSSGSREIRNVEPGEYRVEVTSKSRDYGTAQTSATVTAGSVTPVDVTIPGAGRLALEVKSPSGDWMSGYRVELRGDDGQPASAEIAIPANGKKAIVRKGVVDSPGPVDVGRLRPGSVTVVLTMEGFETVTESVEIRRGEETKLSITLRKSP